MATLPEPEHPALALACVTLDRVLDTLEQARTNDPGEAVAIHVVLRGFRNVGVLDTLALPSTCRRLAENLLIATVRSTKGMTADARAALIRSVFLSIRKVAEAYEAERPGAPDLPPDLENFA